MAMAMAMATATAITNCDGLTSKGLIRKFAIFIDKKRAPTRVLPAVITFGKFCPLSEQILRSNLTKANVRSSRRGNVD